MSNADPAGVNFHIDKRIPVALIFAIGVQTAAGVWWAASISAAQEQAVIDAARLETRVTRIEGLRDDLSARVIRIEEKVSGQNDTLQRILRSVERDTTR